MKVVCDEGVPRALGRRLRELGIEVSPPAPQWRGFANGRLVAAAAAAGFDVLLSNDKNLIFQLNLLTMEIAIVTLPNNRRESLVPRSEDIADTLRRVLPGQCVAIQTDGVRTLRRRGFGDATVVDALPPIAPFSR